MKDLFKTIIKDFQSKPIKNFITRDYSIPTDINKIITLIGPRRSGKTYLIYQIITEILKKDNIENIVYINFEDERIEPEKSELDNIIKAYQELYPENNLENVYFFFDEIQEINGWEKFIRRIYDSISQKIFLTGSSAKLLSKEIATNLRGRTISFEIFPLSFKEFLNFKKINSENIHASKNKAIINNLFFEYIQKGGFPEVTNFDSDTTTMTLQNYFDVMIYRDVIERYNIENHNALKQYSKKLINSISKEHSINKTYNELKSQNIKISKDKLYEFNNYFQDAYIFFNLNKYSQSIQTQESSIKKLYSIDSGMNSAMSIDISKNIGRQLENIIFLHLRKKYSQIFYHKKNKECDFLVYHNNQIKYAIQVSINLNDKETLKREINGVIEASKRYNLQEGIIITISDEKEMIIDNHKIKIIPAWKFLLQ